MHFTPRPRWLMIASTATVVLPVLRSPMISSRWPRPIGVMASIALMPVCSGSRPRVGGPPHPDGAALELEQLVDRAIGQAADAGDAVTHLGDAPDRSGLERG